MGVCAAWGSRVRGRTPCFGGGECHVPLSGVSSWATLVVKLHGYTGLCSKIKDYRGIRAVPLEFRQADPVEFGEFVAGRGLNAEEGTRPSQHKLVGSRLGNCRSLVAKRSRVSSRSQSGVPVGKGSSRQGAPEVGVRIVKIGLSGRGAAGSRVRGRTPCFGGGECHIPLSGVSSWATLVVKLHGYVGLRSKIKECRGIRAVPLEFKQADPVEFGELVAGRGLNAEEGTRPSLHKLVGVWSQSPDEPKAGRNQSLSRLIRLAPWHGSAVWPSVVTEGLGP
ncbi:hypothetical protein ACLB2K_047884 [Fragaria x ananassa]